MGRKQFRLSKPEDTYKKFCLMSAGDRCGLFVVEDRMPKTQMHYLPRITNLTHKKKQRQLEGGERVMKASGRYQCCHVNEISVTMATQRLSASAAPDSVPRGCGAGATQGFIRLQLSELQTRAHHSEVQAGPPWRESPPTDLFSVSLGYFSLYRLRPLRAKPIANKQT